MIKIHHLIFLIVIPLTISGCFPFPHMEKRTPILNGSVTDETGSPVAGLKVTLSKPRDCSKIIQQTETDQNGRFTLGPYSRFVLYLQLEAAHQWEICAWENGRTYYLSRQLRLGPSPEQMTLQCRLSGAEPADTNLCTVRREY